NISDAHNYRPIEDLFRIHLSEKKRCRRILEQASKVGCKAPVAMISSCGMIPGNPYPQGKPSLLNGIFPGTPAKKETEDNSSEGKGISARILGPCKPAPSTYNPHKPVPYPIPPCRPHATIAPTSVPPPPYTASQNSAGTPSCSWFNSFDCSASANGRARQLPPAASAPPVCTCLSNPDSNSPAPSVIKGPPLPASPLLTPGPGPSTPIPQGFPGLPPSLTPTPSVIKSHTPSGTPCGTPVPNGSYTPVPSGYPGMSRSGTPTSKGSSTPGPIAFTPQGHLPPSSQGSADPSSSPSLGLPNPLFKGFPPSDTQAAFPGLPPAASPAQTQSVIRSYTPSATPTPQGSSPFTGLPPSSTPTPKPLAMSAQNVTANPMGAVNPHYVGTEQHMSALARHGGSGSNSPVPSAFKGPSRSSTPSLSSLVMPNSAALALTRSLGLGHSAASAQATLSSTAAMAGLQGLPALGTQPGGNPVSHAAAVYSGLPGFPGTASLQASLSGNACASSASIQVSAPSSSIYAGLPPSAAPSPSPFSLGLSTPVSSIFPGLPPGALGSGNASFPSFAASNTPAGSPVLSSFMGLSGPPSSVATVAPLQAAVAAAAVASPSSAPVLPGFASAFSSNFNPALVAQAGLTTGLQPAGGTAFPGLLSFPAIPGFSPSGSPAALSGLHNTAVQSALLQVWHSA
ncbi:PRSR1 protein, partial [Amia calva]|nr:PRSR1 protein [Amia calva]